MDVLEPVIEDIVREPVCVECKELIQDLLCHAPLIDLLVVKHQHVRDINQKIRTGDLAVRCHGREERRNIPATLSRQPAFPYYIGSHPFTLVYPVLLVMY
jgi:hypothetical protein